MERQEWRDEFFKPFKELLPPSQLKMMEQSQIDTPEDKQLEKSKFAFNDNPAFKFMLGKAKRLRLLRNN